MGNMMSSEKVSAASTEAPSMMAPSDEQPKKLKACCACPETKKARDTCIIENGQENCTALIEAHKECMRKAGFNI